MKPKRLFRLPVEPNDRNGLSADQPADGGQDHHRSEIHVGAQIGRLENKDILWLNQAVLVFLGLAGSPGTRFEA
jgi:mRNA interferase MazF